MKFLGNPIKLINEAKRCVGVLFVPDGMAEKIRDDRHVYTYLHTPGVVYDPNNVMREPTTTVTLTRISHDGWILHGVEPADISNYDGYAFIGT